jgi:xylulokinase
LPTEPDQYVLALDLGTGGPKVALVSTSGEVVAHEAERNELFILPGGGAEQSPDDWWNAFAQASRRLLQRGLVPADRVVAISCTTQWSGTVAVDRDGKPLMNAVIWLDSRGAKYMKRLARGIDGAAEDRDEKLATWIRLTGGAPSRSGKDPIGHILLIRNEYPEVYRQTFKFLEPMDYFNLRLTGKFAASYHSITLHWATDNRDLSKVRYVDELLALSELERDKLPDLEPTGAILGPITPAVANELGLREDVQVVMGTGDTASAAVGSGAVRDFESHLYIGTSSWLTCHVPFKRTDTDLGIASLPSGIPGRYAVGVEQETAGACLTTLGEKILFGDDELSTGTAPPDLLERLNRVAEGVPPGSDKLIFTPWIHGERTPLDDPYVRGGFLNQSLNTTRAHLVRAVFEGVAYNTRWMHETVEAFVERRLDGINFVGGGANSDLWSQIHADVLNRTIRQTKDPIHAGVRGAALLASVALGLISVDQITDCVEITNTYEPNPENRAIYDELYREFQTIYENNKQMYARLNARSGTR